MRVLSAILPQAARNRLRHMYDSFYGKSFPDKETLGEGSQWTIRTAELHSGSTVYSGGVGGDITFELELIRRFGVLVHIFDPSPIALRTIALANSGNLLFKPVGLAASDSGNFSVGSDQGERTWLKKGGDRVIPCTGLKTEMAKNGHDHIDLLKIDIEGFEYEILEEAMGEHIRVKQICVEFHDFFPEISKEKTRNVIHSLELHGYQLIHRHRHDHTFYRCD